MEIESCSKDDYTEIKKKVGRSTIIVKNSGENRNNETLVTGTDTDGTVYRVLIKFDLSEYKTDNNFAVANVMESWIHLNYIGLTDGTEEQRKNRTINVYKVTKDWDEKTVTWDDIAEEHDDSPVGSAIIEESRLGGTDFTIRVDDTVKEWVETGVREHYGFILIDEDESTSSRVPTFVDDDDESPRYYQPELSICQERTITTSTSPVTTTHQAVTTTTPTVTTEPLTEFTGCRTASVVPSERITVEEYPDNANDTTLCVSVEPVHIQYCEDTTGRCKLAQTRDVYGRLQTFCSCCLPILGTKAFTFDCGPEKRQKEIEIDVIHTCRCFECDSPEQRVQVEDKRAALVKRGERDAARAATYIL